MKIQNTTAAQHTVGPWSAYKDASGYQLLSRSLKSSNVFGRFRPHLGDHAHQEQANARLIAAAPELLEALREIELLAREIKRSHVANVIACKCIDAIAKAALQSRGAAGGEGEE